MGKDFVVMSNRALKDIKKIPHHILLTLDKWVETIELHGYREMQRLIKYRDHVLKGNRKRQRSSSLSRSYRVIYQMEYYRNYRIFVLEVNKHDY